MPPDKEASSSPISLYDLANRIKKELHTALPDNFWVIAEIAQIKNVNNNYYLTLIDRDKDVTRAKIDATIWSSSYAKIAGIFRDATGKNLTSGMKILFACKINYHETYGLKLTISAVDPAYTLGEMARRRAEIIAQLKKEDLLDRNRQIPFPLVPQRVAVISSDSAAGYGDINKVLRENRFGYQFTLTLFQAAMQGDRTEESVTGVLEEIAHNRNNYDVIIIVRGGGSSVDLSAFDNYAIGRAIALSPLPVLTGIGHARDETVADIVAHRKIITPTDGGNFLVDCCRQFEEKLTAIMQKVADSCQQRIDAESQKLTIWLQKIQVRSLNYLTAHLNECSAMATRVQNAAHRILETDRQRIDQNFARLRDSAASMLLRDWQRLELMDQSIRLLDPINTLKRGFSITYYDGRAVKETGQLSVGFQISTRLYSGMLTSRIETMEVTSEQQ